MAETANQVLHNSATSRRLDNPFRTTGDQPLNKGVIRNVANLNFGDAGVALGNRLLSGIRAGRANSLAEEMGPLLTARGPGRDMLLQALEDRIARSSIDRAAGDKAAKIGTHATGASGLAAIEKYLAERGQNKRLQFVAPTQ